IAVVYLATSNYYPDYRSHGWHWNFPDWGYSDRSDDYDYNEREDWTDQVLSEAYDEAIENAVLDLDAVAGEFTIGKTTSYLLKFTREGNIGKYYLDAENAGSAAVLKLSMGDKTIRGKNMVNDVEIDLNPEPVWDIKLDAGAAKIDFDLSDFKIDRVDIDGGASAIKIRLGDLYDKTDLRINTGASSITIYVPEDVGCEVRTSTVLTGKKLDDFDKIKSDLYRTSGFEDADKQIFIEIDAAVSSLKVLRY
nr:hypothetical protein [Bacteroidota bacterium]